MSSCHSSIRAEPGLEALVRVVDKADRSPVILHVPHASRHIPEHLRESFVIDADGIEAELDAMTDAFTDRIADAVPGASRMDHGLSRLLVDVERFDGDEEEMNRVGMGVLYTHGSHLQEIRRPSPWDREELLGYFHAYSEAFTDLVEHTLALHGRAVIIDLHSYPRDPLPYELHADERRPQLCIGVDPVHTPAGLVEAVRIAFDGYELAENQPFHGSYVPLRHYGIDRRVESVMLEIRRDTYINADGSAAEPQLRDLGRRSAALVEALLLSRRANSDDIPGER